MEYDDTEALYGYLLAHHPKLLTPLERVIARHLQAELKASGTTPELARLIRRKWGARSDPAVQAALANDEPPGARVHAPSSLW